MSLFLTAFGVFIGLVIGAAILFAIAYVSLVALWAVLESWHRLKIWGST